MIHCLLTLILLHPGHATRIELGLSEVASKVEVAIRFDAADLEAALRKSTGKAVDIASSKDDEAKEWLSTYLRRTWLIDGAKLNEKQFHWVGWEREHGQVWVYFELSHAEPPASGKKKVKLQVQSLFEVEPEVQHVLVDRTQGVATTRIVRSSEKVTELEF